MVTLGQGATDKVTGDIANAVWRLSEALTPQRSWDPSAFWPERDELLRQLEVEARDDRFPILPGRLVAEIRRALRDEAPRRVLVDAQVHAEVRFGDVQSRRRLGQPCPREPALIAGELGARPVEALRHHGQEGGRMGCLQPLGRDLCQDRLADAEPGPQALHHVHDAKLEAGLDRDAAGACRVEVLAAEVCEAGITYAIERWRRGDA